MGLHYIIALGHFMGGKSHYPSFYPSLSHPITLKDYKAEGVYIYMMDSFRSDHDLLLIHKVQLPSLLLHRSLEHLVCNYDPHYSFLPSMTMVEE
nr:hypothetical protein Q903MT_gene3387 [Picea sitchensis]